MKLVAAISVFLVAATGVVQAAAPIRCETGEFAEVEGYSSADGGAYAYACNVGLGSMGAIEFEKKKGGYRYVYPDCTYTADPNFGGGSCNCGNIKLSEIEDAVFVTRTYDEEDPTIVTSTTIDGYGADLVQALRDACPYGGAEATWAHSCTCK